MKLDVVALASWIKKDAAARKGFDSARRLDWITETNTQLHNDTSADVRDV